MNTRISYLSCIVLGLIFPGAAVSQSMGDRSSVYNAMWFDDTNVYVTGQIAGLMSVHIYAVDLTLQTPSGTNISSYPSFSPGWVVNTVMAPWTADDLGADFLATVQDRFYCVPGRTYYSLAFAQLKQRPKLPKYSCTAELTTFSRTRPTGRLPSDREKAHRPAIYRTTAVVLATLTSAAGAAKKLARRSLVNRSTPWYHNA